MCYDQINSEISFLKELNSKEIRGEISNLEWKTINGALSAEYSFIVHPIQIIDHFVINFTTDKEYSRMLEWDESCKDEGSIPSRSTI